MNSNTKLDIVDVSPVEFDPFAGQKILFTAPSTESQKEIWASVQMGDEANCAYNESISLLLKGKFDYSAFQNAVIQLVKRHDALRTLFGPDGKTLCITEASETSAISQIDLSFSHDLEKKKELDNILSRAVETPFDIEHGPLFSIIVIKFNDITFQVIFTAHHIICDGWSTVILISELASLYSAIKNECAPLLDEVLPFSEYAKKQSADYKSKERTESELYWLSQYSEIPLLLDLPIDYPRPALRTFNSRREDYIIEKSLVSQIKQLASKSGCSFFVVMLAAFKVLLYRLTEQNDIVVGIPSAGQSLESDRVLVGHCVNLLPVRTYMKSDNSFIDVIHQVKTEMLDAYENQNYTYGTLLKMLDLKRDFSRIPLLSVIFNIDQRIDNTTIHFHELEVEFTSNPRHYENFEIFINAMEVTDGLRVECQYNTDLFSAESIVSRLEEFSTLLKAVVFDPNKSIGCMSLLTTSESKKLNDWNRTSVILPSAACIHQLFEAQVERTPTIDAVVFGTDRISYHELNARANKVAHWLNSRHIGVDVLVGIFMDRSIEMVIAILSVLKAGGAYVPLDPKYPKERIAFMIEDCHISLIITQNRLIDQLQEYSAVVLRIDSQWESINTLADYNLKNETRPENLAYIIYTSGSTGKPKGVAIEHRNTAALINWAGSVFSKEEFSGVLACTSICFDLSIFELLVTLCHGGKVILAENLMALPDLEAREEIKLINSVPSAIEQLIANYKLPSSITTVNLAGELLTNALVKRIYKFENVKKVYDLYGPSEDTTYSTFALRVSDGRQTIGKPIANTKAYILDRMMQRVPIGVVGELYIGGPKLSRGYVNRPELTAERFLDDPFTDVQGQRMYRTGDRVRFFPDGEIEFLGRLDNQVKIRGFRIELGEVEYCILENPIIKQAVVTVVDVKPGDNRLISFIVVNENSVFELDVMKKFLRQKLPEYMIPQHFIVLERLPVTPNQKIDRKMLHRLFLDNNLGNDEFISASTDIQKSILTMWQEALGFCNIGVNDNFFDLGGHSLLVIQITSRIRKKFGFEISMGKFFELPTIALQAMHIETVQRITNRLTNTYDTINDREEIEL